ncbi:MAG: RNA polymerase sigma factor [Novosphingobium sp.]
MGARYPLMRIVDFGAVGRGRALPEGGLAATFELERAALLRFLAARAGNADEAEDFLQDLWIKLQTPTSAPVANPKAYLFRMANNLVLDARRARQRAMTRDRGWINADGDDDCAPEDRKDPGLPADEEIAARQEAQVLQSAIDALPDGARRALVLYRFEERGQAEIAQIMGISRSGVEKHLAVAMKHLRKALCDCGLFATVASEGQENTKGHGLETGSTA